MTGLSRAEKSEALFRELEKLLTSSCCAYYWYNSVSSPRTIRGGSSFILRFSGRLVGITAYHVVQIYKDEKSSQPEIISQLETLAFDIANALIDFDQDLDIATFAVSEAELSKTGKLALDCRYIWPPPEPILNNLIGFAGFPEFGQRLTSETAATLESYVGMTLIGGIGERDIFTTCDPSRGDRSLIAQRPSPPPGLNLSGCSGGPVLVFANISGLFCWFPVALIVGGPGGSTPAGDTVAFGTTREIEFDTIVVRRIHFVNPDGSIIHPASSGWLL